MSGRLTEKQLDDIMQWACSSDLRQREGEELQMLVEEVRALRAVQQPETLDADIAFVDRAVAVRILDMRRHTTMTGEPMSDEHWKEMDGVTRAWDRIRHRLGRK